MKFITICLSMLLSLEKNAEELQAAHAKEKQLLEVAKNRQML
jgi:hypothetical protein